jgi:tetratricopeptide (TPR) repeat protein
VKRFRPASLLTAALVAAAAPAAARAEDEPLDLEAETTASDAQLEQWLTEGKAASRAGNHGLAAQRLREVLNQAAPESPLVPEATFQLGVALHKLGLLQSAFMQLERVVDTGAAHPHYDATLKLLLDIARRTGHDPSVMLRIAEYPPETYPSKDADELNFLVGQFHYNEEALEDALKRFDAVGPADAKVFARARYLKGVIHVARSGLGSEKAVDAEQLSQAADAFKAVLRLRAEDDSEVVARIADEATLALGRLFFSTRQYDVAVRYYDAIASDNPRWLEAVHEAAWVHFQLKNYGKSLGLLHTVNSPYFIDQYFPETRVLQALILFYNCRYDDADAIVKEFVADYYPLMNQFRAEINQFGDPNAFYGWLAKLSSDDSGEYSARFKRIFNAALEDKKLRRKFEVVTNLNRELKQLDALTAKGADPRFIASLKGDVESYRALVVGEAGALAQSRLVRVMRDLQRHLASALKIKGETLRARRGDISNAAAEEQAAASQAYKPIVVDAEHVAWPFDGEYWRDELGFYVYDLESRCAASPDASAP